MDRDKFTTNHDCNYCRNANTCEDLNHGNDLSYKTCGLVECGARLFFKTGNAQVTELFVETYRNNRLEVIARLVPNYCPFCGRELVENTKKFNIRRI